MKFKIKNLGKIKEADIEVKPLTVFVGKNGTHKSYMAHVVYGIATYPDIIDVIKILEELIYSNEENFIKIVEEILGLRNLKKKKEIYLKSSELKSLTEYFLKLFMEEINKEIQDSIGEVFHSKKHFSNLKVKIDMKLDNIPFKDITLSVNSKEDKISPYNTNVSFQLKDKLYGLLKEFLMENYFLFKNVYYFPSSRTGFVLAFDDIVAGVFRERFGGRSTTKLTQPIIDFLSNFADIKTKSFIDILVSDYLSEKEFLKREKEKIKRLLLFLEKRILKGQILEKKEYDKYTKFIFKPSNSEEELELHITSSATIELLPLIEFLKNFSVLDNKLLIIEEPEAHLHPKAQIEIAKFLTLLVNNGINILITTHSDYIIHEISNCIKLFNLSEEEKKEFLKREGLEDYPDIAISQDKVATYLFKENKDRIDIERLKVNKFGIEDKNFEDVIDELFERSTTLGEKLVENSKN